MEHIKKPDWLKIKLQSGHGMKTVEEVLKKYRLNSVCREAKCPNRAECFSKKTATFIILGTECTRGCLFCNISGKIPFPPDLNEPGNVAEAVSELALKYVVITSVTRDDLPDGGSGHFHEVVRQIREKNRDVAVEVLIPDFEGKMSSLTEVLDAEPTVLNHNMETVERLYGAVRKGARYKRSLDLLENAKKYSDICTKSGIILGMGEREDELFTLLKDLRSVDCDLLTIGQYLAPTKDHFPVKEFILPEQFQKWEEIALDMGFKGVKAGPMVRSSYNAASMMKSIQSS